MRLSIVRAAAAAAAIACGVGGAAIMAGPAQAGTAAPSASHVVIVTCAGKGATKPTSFIITCADGYDYLKTLTWTSWGSTAGGSGKNEINNCIPACYKGKFHSYPVDVTLWRPKPWPHHSGKQYFSRMTLKYLKAIPKGFHRTRVVDLWSN